MLEPSRQLFERWWWQKEERAAADSCIYPTAYVCRALRTGRGGGPELELTGPYGMSHDVREDTSDAEVRQLRDRALWEKQPCVSEGVASESPAYLLTFEVLFLAAQQDGRC